MTATPAEVPGPLRGIRILDLSRVLAAPFCVQTLGDLGADVIKIERPASGDESRQWGPPWFKDPQGNPTSESAYFMSANRNKRSVAVDLAKPEGQALIRKLAEQADICIENFKVGDLARYGLDRRARRSARGRPAAGGGAFGGLVYRHVCHGVHPGGAASSRCHRRRPTP